MDDERFLKRINNEGIHIEPKKPPDFLVFAKRKPGLFMLNADALNVYAVLSSETVIGGRSAECEKNLAEATYLTIVLSDHLNDSVLNNSMTNILLVFECHRKHRW